MVTLQKTRGAIMNQPKVSIIILNWNGLEDTTECLESLKQITYSNYKVIVVDNGSQGNDVQVLKERFGDYIHLIENDRNYGYTGGSNIGIRYARSNRSSDYILLLNNDTVVDPEFLTEMVKVAEGDLAIGIAGAKIYYYDNPNQLQDIRGKINLWKGEPASLLQVVATEIRRTEIDKEQYDITREADWIGGCCFLIKKGALENIGLFDESYFCYWEEVDYCLRARRAGYKVIYVPAAKVWHKLGQSTRKAPGFSCYYGVRNRFYFTKKHATRWQYRCFLVYFFSFYFWLAIGYYLIFKHNPKVLLSFWRGIINGLSRAKRGGEQI